jgi:hypothetical protein
MRIVGWILLVWGVILVTAGSASYLFWLWLGTREFPEGSAELILIEEYSHGTFIFYILIGVWSIYGGIRLRRFDLKRHRARAGEFADRQEP